jgi:hypothetical protein
MQARKDLLQGNVFGKGRIHEREDPFKEISLATEDPRHREEPWLGKMLSKGRSWEKEYLRQVKIL